MDSRRKVEGNEGERCKKGMGVVVGVDHGKEGKGGGLVWRIGKGNVAGCWWYCGSWVDGNRTIPGRGGREGGGKIGRAGGEGG